MTSYEIKHITSDLMYKWAVIFFLCYIPFRFWAQNRALKNIKAMLEEGEKIIYKPTILYYAEWTLPLFAGAFLGCGLLPFFLYPEIQQLKVINRVNLPFWIISEMVGIFAMLFFACWKFAITNKRIITCSAFNFVHKFFKKLNLNYKDIKSVELVKSYWFTDINIFLNNGEFFFLSSLQNIGKVKTIIDEQMNIDKQNINIGG